VTIARSAGIAVSVLALLITARRGEAQYVMVRVPTSVLERYVGEYAYPGGNTVMVRLRGDTLFREIPGQQVPFVPLSETRFQLGPVFTAEFVIDDKGGVTQILSDGVAVEYRLVRKGSSAATQTAVAPAVRIPKSVLERYAGEYEFIPGQMGRTDLLVSVRLKGDTLLGAMSGVQEVVLTPISETRFRYGSTSIAWEFVSDQSNGVTLVMGTGSQQLKARRKMSLRW
jgi:hypothetical protein